MTSSDEIMPSVAGSSPSFDPSLDPPLDEVGVGPWEGPWPEDPRYDPDLLRDGDRRNVADHFRYWTVEAIVAELDTRRHPLQVAIENWAHDLNIGSVVRTANAFNVAGVHIVGRRRWNRRGAMVTDRYLHVHHHLDADELVTWASARGLTVIGVDNLPGAVPIEAFDLPRDCLLVFGQEGPGLSEATRAACAATLSIAQYGSTRSINASAAAAIAMHTWIRAHATPAGADLGETAEMVVIESPNDAENDENAVLTDSNGGAHANPADAHWNHRLRPQQGS